MPIPRVLEAEAMSGPEEASAYDEMDFSATDQRFAERAAALAANARRVLDIDSGNARIPLAMCALLPPRTTVCAVDLSSAMLAVGARNRARAGLPARRLLLIEGDAKRLPFASGMIDVVTSNSLVHHIPDPRAVFTEIARVVRRGGAILLRDLIRPASEATLQQLVALHAAQVSALQKKLFVDSLRAALTVDEIQGMLGECGLGDARVSQITDRHWSAERA
jgi:ubiquinone/menaquinone biosynthesis C-methylase UbiE